MGKAGNHFTPLACSITEKELMNSSGRRLRHGGDLAEAMNLLGSETPHSAWLDLSTGINLKSYPVPNLETSTWTTLPSNKDVLNLESVAKQYYDAPVSAEIAAAPGSQSIIQLLPSAIPATKVSIVGPTYSEHAASWFNSGSSIDEITALDAKSEVVVVVNPNNPDGRIYKTEELFELAVQLTSKDGWLVLDEAFADSSPGVSSVKLVDRTNTIVIKSFGKFFGLPGARLGFAIGNRNIIARIRKKLGPWAVCGPSIATGTSALADVEWQRNARLELEEYGIWLNRILRDCKLKILGGTTLFTLVDTNHAEALFYHLLENQIYVRRFDSNKNWLRFGTPRSTNDLSRLKDVLEKFKG